MQNYALTLTQMGYEADINSSDNLVKIVKRLPVNLQSNWADEAGNLTLTGIEPTFSHLAKFVGGKAMLASTMYGEIVGSALHKERSTTQPSKEKTAGRDEGKTYKTQSRAGDGSVRNATPPVPNCPLCSDYHRLAKCQLMEAKSPEERKGFVRQAGSRGNYFGSGCMAIECSSKMKCQVNGCGWKRHTMLHLVRKKNRMTLMAAPPCGANLRSLGKRLEPGTLFVVVLQSPERRMFV